MRFFIAAVLYLVSLAMIAVGVAERTIWAPAPSKDYVVLLDGKTPYVLVDNATLTKYSGQPILKVTGGSQNNIVIQGRESDIVGWLGDDAHTRVVFDEAGKKLLFSNVDGPIRQTDPTISDMWRDVKTDESNVSLGVATKDEGALLITNNGLDAAPNSITLVWKIKHDLTPSNLLILGGASLILVGVILNFLAWYSMRKNRGPRRRTPKAPQGPKYRPKRKTKNDVVNTRGRRSSKSFTAIAVTGLVLSSLSACTISVPNATPTPTETAINQTDPSVLSAEQISLIVADVAAVAKKGDEAKSAEELKSRFDGPALVARTAHYLLQSKSRSIKNLPIISSEIISFQLPAASRTWPRTAFVVTDSNSGDQLPQMLVLQQSTPRDKYKIWYVISILPGAQFPAVPTTEVGSIPVAADSLFLKVQPNQLAAVYGDLIDKGEASEYFSIFDVKDDAYYEQISKSQRDTIAKLTKATVTVTHELAEANVLALATVDSGALVAVYMNDVYEIRPKRRSAVTVEGNEKLLYGAQGSAKGIRSVYGDVLLFYVPSSSSDEQVRTLGATQFLLSVKSLR